MAGPTSSLDVWNLALLQVCQETIGSFTDKSVPARVGSRIYDWRRQDLLRNYVWNFARKRIIINPVSGDTPAYDFDTFYDLPSDCLRFHAVGDRCDRWWPIRHDIQEKRLLLNSSDLNAIGATPGPIKVMYTRDETDVTKFDKLFLTCLVLDLAANACIPITGDAKLQMAFEQRLRAKLAEAVAVNHQERPMEVIERDPIRVVRSSEFDNDWAAAWRNGRVIWPE